MTKYQNQRLNRNVGFCGPICPAPKVDLSFAVRTALYLGHAFHDFDMGDYVQVDVGVIF